MAKRLAGLHPLAYMGVNPTTPPQMIHRNHAPTANDNKNVTIGTIWIITDTPNVYMLTGLAGSVATWTKIVSATSVEIVDAVAPIVATTVGDTTTVSITNGTDGQLLIGGGSAPIWATLESSGGSVTITESANGINLEAAGVAAMTALEGDSGTATPVAGVVIIAGGANITTSGAGQTITVALDASPTLTDLIVESITVTDLSAGVVISDSGGLLSNAGGGLGTNGQLLIGATGGIPAWANLTSSAGTVLISEGANTINLEALTNPSTPYELNYREFTITSSFSDLAYQSPTFVMTQLGGGVGRIATSTDLVNWTNRLSINAAKRIHCEPGGYCVAVGSRTAGLSGASFYSNNPTGAWSWHDFPLVSFTGTAINYGGGYWLAGGSYSSTGQLFYSTDPTSAWTSGAATPNSVEDVVYGGGVWVVVGRGNYLASSNDPTGAFTQHTSPFAYTNQPSGTTTISGAAYSSTLSLFVIGNNNGALATSPDGTTWTRRLNPIGLEIIGTVEWDSGQELFLVCAESCTVYSADGIYWFSETKKS